MSAAALAAAAVAAGVAAQNMNARRERLRQQPAKITAVESDGGWCTGPIIGYFSWGEKKQMRPGMYYVLDENLLFCNQRLRGEAPKRGEP